MNDRRRRFEAEALPHLDAVYNLAKWLARPPCDADDIVQDAMMRAFVGFDSFRGDNVKPWLLSIVRNCFLDAVRNSQRRRSEPLPSDDDLGPDDSAWAVDDPDPEAVMIQADERCQLHKVVANLPKEFREVLVLREMEYLSYREIAEITGAPIGTVMSRLARARGVLRQRWNSDIEGPRLVAR
jgi:RNA polymerase sigma factor (sigma-70 family)